MHGFARLPSVRRRYPFDALHWLRYERVKEQAALVSESAARTGRAQADEARAAAARRSAQLAIERLAGTEQTRLDEGQLRAGDLQVVADWRTSVDAELREQVEREQRARDARLREAAAEAAARQALGNLSNQAKMIDTHRNSFRKALAAQTELAEEEAAQEQWTARHFPPRKR